MRPIADCGYEYEENKGIFLLWGTRKDLLFIGNFHRFPPFSPVFPGKVNHFAANLRHFPAGNVDSTAIFAVFFSGKVNQITANPRHFPAENVDFTTISPFFPGKVNHFAANSRHFPPPSLSPPTHTTPNTRPSAPPETGSWLFRKQAYSSSGNKLCPSSLFFILHFTD